MRAGSGRREAVRVGGRVKRHCGPGVCEGRWAGVLRLCVEGVQTAVMYEEGVCG